MEKVSIIIPVYNTEDYFEKCLQSVLNQTHSNLEILIINDGNNLSFSQKLNELINQDSRIKIINNEKRKGVGYSRNLGMENATGEYIYFIDSDDYIDQDAIKKLMDNTSELDIIKGFIKRTLVSNSVFDTSNRLYQLKKYNEDRFTLINNKSVLNTLFRRKYIKENNLKFSEKVEFYSELDFLIPAYLNTKHVLYSVESIYYHRKRNDPINNPSLIQVDPYRRITTYLDLYVSYKSIYKDAIVQEYLDQQMLDFYKKDIISYINNEENAIKKIFTELSNVVTIINTSIVTKNSVTIVREIKTLQSKNKEKYKRINKQHVFLRKLKRILTSRSRMKRAIYNQLFLKLPIKNNVIFFESFLGKNYSDSPKAIYEQLILENDKYKCVWSFNETGKKLPGKAIQVKRFSLQYFYYVARAKYWVSNSRLPKYLEKREGNVYLQTWHGTPLKKLVFDMDDIHSADPNYKANFYAQSRRWDYLSSPNKYSSDIFKRAFKFDKEMLEFGYPRNDVLYNKNNENNILNIKEKLQLPEGKKVILYAPTWRDDEYFSRGRYKFELQLDLRQMQKRLGEEYIVVLRMHYFIANQLNLSEFNGFAYDYSLYDDIAELYLVSDILITDYSSVFFDYSNLKRPILFFTYDIEKYRDKLRGFYLNMEEELPGPLLKTSEEVIHSIENIKDITKEYKNKYNEFYSRFCEWEGGKSSENTIKAVFNKKI